MHASSRPAASRFARARDGKRLRIPLGAGRTGSFLQCTASRRPTLLEAVPTRRAIWSWWTAHEVSWWCPRQHPHRVAAGPRNDDHPRTKPALAASLEGWCSVSRLLSMSGYGVLMASGRDPLEETFCEDDSSDSGESELKHWRDDDPSCLECDPRDESSSDADVSQCRRAPPQDCCDNHEYRTDTNKECQCQPGPKPRAEPGSL